MKHKIPAVLLLALLLLQGIQLGAQQNPFLTTNSEKTEDKRDDGQVYTKANPLINSRLMQSIKEKQKQFQARISGYISDYKATGNTDKLLVFLLFAYAYGLLHVLGPGHRKIFLFTYFVSRPSRWKQGMLAGVMTALLHALSAVFFIGGLYLITSRTLLSRFNNITPLLERISYGAIILIGIYLLLRHIAAAFKRDSNAHCGHSHGSSRNPDTMLFILASGLVPCPGAATIMIFSIAVQAPLVGIWAVLAMSLGMASVLMFVPPAAILLRTKLDPLIEKWNPETGERIHSGLSIAGAAVLILFGFLFII